MRYKTLTHIEKSLLHSAAKCFFFIFVASCAVHSIIAQDYFKRNISIRLFNDGVKLERSGDTEEAAEAYERAIDADPSNPFPYLNLGSIAFRQGDFLLSRYYYLMSFRNDPSYKNARENLALCDRKLASLDKKGLEVIGQDSFNRGASLYSEKKFSQAAIEFMRYTGLNSERGEGYLQAGRSFLACRRFAAAEKTLTVAVQFSGLDAEVALLIAEASKGTGDIKRALDMYRFALNAAQGGGEKDATSAKATEEREKAIAEKIANLEEESKQIMSNVIKLEEAFASYLPLLSDKGKEDLRLFLFNRVSEGLDESRIKEEIAKALETSLLGFNFDNGLVKLSFPEGWYQVSEEKRASSPIAIFRKYPGDSQLALYLIHSKNQGLDAIVETAYDLISLEEGKPKIERLPESFSSADHAAAFNARYAFEEAGIEDLNCWVFSLDKAPSFCLACALTGYAGMSADEMEKTFSEIQDILLHAHFDREFWKEDQGIEAKQTLFFPLPPEYAGKPPFSEADMPWRVLRGYGFTIIVPPGIVGRRVDLNDPERTRDSMVMWMRGEFTDSSGMKVKIGNENFAAYIDTIECESKEKTREYVFGNPSPAPPAPDVEAKLLSSLDYSLIAREAAGAEPAWVGKYQGKEFPGKWIIFRMAYGTRVIEFGFPVLEGEDSISLFWVPTTFRLEGMPPAFPPVDAAAKFKIAFKKASFSETKGLFGKEGDVITPDFRVEVPSGWRVSINYRSIDGYPVSLKEEKGESVVRIFKIGKEKDTTFAKKRARDLMCESCELEWQTLEKSEKHGAKTGMSTFYEKREEDSIELNGAQIFASKQGNLFLVFFMMSDTGWESYSGQSIKKALASLSFF